MAKVTIQEDNLWKKETYETMKEVCKKNPEYLLE